MGLIVPVGARSEAVPSQASVGVGLWGTGPAFGSVNLGSFGFGINPVASVGGVFGRDTTVEARLGASSVDMPYSRGVSDVVRPSVGGSVGGLVLGSQNALRPVDTVAVSTSAHPFAGATFVDVSARAGAIGGCGKGGSLLPTNARDSLFATLSWVEYDELYRCKGETDRMLQYIARLEQECLLYRQQFEECKLNCMDTCKRVCAENEQKLGDWLSKQNINYNCKSCSMKNEDIYIKFGEFKSEYGHLFKDAVIRNPTLKNINNWHDKLKILKLKQQLQ
jgi:hypothetical protein